MKSGNVQSNLVIGTHTRSYQKWFGNKVNFSVLPLLRTITLYDYCLMNCRLLGVIQCPAKLYLVFEYLRLDLKKYLNSCPENGLPLPLVKVSVEWNFISVSSV